MTRGFDRELFIANNEAFNKVRIKARKDKIDKTVNFKAV